MTLLFTLGMCASASAQGIAALWNLCPKGKDVTIGSHIVAEMIVISDCDSPNMSPSVNISVGTLETRLNRRTVYVSTPDGKIGLKLLFDRPGENALHRGDVVEIDFYGCKASHTRKAGRGARVDLVYSGNRNLADCLVGTSRKDSYQ